MTNVIQLGERRVDKSCTARDALGEGGGLVQSKYSLQNMDLKGQHKKLNPNLTFDRLNFQFSSQIMMTFFF